MANGTPKKLDLTEDGTYWVVPDEQYRRTQAQQQTPRLDQKSQLVLQFLGRLGAEVFSIPFLIKHFREQKDWSQRDLDRESGIPYSRICNFEKGLADPEQGSLDKLADALGEEFRQAVLLLRQINEQTD